MLQIKHIEIEGFTNFLMSLELKGKSSRMRTRFCKLLGERIKQVEEERMDLIKQFSKKGENGEPEIEVDEQTGQRIYKLDDREGFSKEYDILMNEVFVVEATEERKEMLKTIQDITLDVDISFSGEQALIYDRWCEIVEEITF